MQGLAPQQDAVQTMQRRRACVRQTFNHDLPPLEMSGNFFDNRKDRILEEPCPFPRTRTL